MRPLLGSSLSWKIIGLLTLVGTAVVGILTTRKAPARPNVIILMIDTLRADAVGYDGADRRRTPFIASLADRGHVFTRAYSPSSWTKPAVASLFSGRYQSQHRVIEFASKLPDSETTLAEVFKSDGYATAGFTTNLLVGGGHGFGQGFDVYRVLFGRKTADGEFHKVRAGRLQAAALRWLKKDPDRRTPFFLYVHYMEPHTPYAPPAWAVAETNTRGQLQFPRAADDLYASEILALDRALEKFFARLKRQGFLNNTIVALVSDHGEEFWEHGDFGHGHTLFEELLRTPLLLMIPEQQSRVTFDRPVSMIDLPPTLLELAALPVPPAFEGASVSSEIGDGWAQRLRRALWRDLDWSPQPDTVFAELLERSEQGRKPRHVRAVVSESNKLLETPAAIERFDLAEDPGEKRPLHASSVEHTDLLDLLAHLRRFEPDAEGGSVPLDKETRERMRALGYE